MSDSSRHNLYAVREVTYGTTPDNPALKKLRHTGCNLGLTKGALKSAEIRSDRQVADFRHGNRQTAGDVNCELSYGSFDDQLEEVMCGTWSTPAAALTATTISAASADNSLNDAGNGMPALSPGDVIAIKGFTGTAGNNGLATVVSRTAAKVVISGITLVNDSAGESVTITPLSILKAGTTRRSSTLLRDYSDMATGRYQRYMGQEVNKMALKVAPNAIVTVDFSYVGQDMAAPSDSAPSGATYPAQTTTSPMDSFTGALKLNGTQVSTVTEVSLTLENGISVKPVVGSALTIRPSIGESNLTGNLNSYFEDASMVENFVNEAVLTPEFVLGDGAAGNAYMFRLPKVKLTAAQGDVKSGPVTVSAPIQGIYDSVSGTQILIAKVPAGVL